MTVRIVPVTTLDPAPDAAALAQAWNDVLVATTVATMGDDHDAWSLASRRAREASTSWSHRYFAAVAEVDGADRVVAAAELMLPLHDNEELALLDVCVAPEHRRRGIGTLVHDHLTALAREAGRTTFVAETAYLKDGTDPGEGFLERQGFALAQTMLRNDLDLTDLDRTALTPRNGSATAGYVIETSTDDTLDEWLEDRAHLQRRMSTDSPVGDLEFHEEGWDADRLRAQRETTRQSGRRAFESVARHSGSGRLVAFTQLQVPTAEPVLAYQQDTLVLREHRGHGLGAAVKAANLAALRRELPQARTVRTWNAQENGPMILVNEAIGFRTTATLREWQRRRG
ncbi:GNAT family N-acetyltransferase [Knoellia locipacati]|uniref:GNAT family N-acetyltransferase n=1 Tax=Knoellia locipacati TaxID=882824 RepID=A0A512SX65_9MICO|nr:GNAT family N-acetyltransferase [Knoellia locipacati]GEQ12537.1 GNAT family N-acetyltransferase [Knoellia locipacati]